MKDVQEDTKVRVACYMAYQNSPWIEAAWESEAAKDRKSVCRDGNDILDGYAVGICICNERMYDGDELVAGNIEAYLETHKKVTGRPSKKGKKGDIHGKEDAK